MMQGVCLKLYVAENRKVHGKLVYEYLLEKSRSMGIHGASVFRATAGFGRHGKLHEESFFELAGNLPIELEFVVTESEAQRLLSLVEAEALKLFYVKFPVEFGVVGET